MQAVPLYLSEIAPAHARGTLNIMFQMATTIGIWVAQWINYGTQNMHPTAGVCPWVLPLCPPSSSSWAV